MSDISDVQKKPEIFQVNKDQKRFFVLALKNLLDRLPDDDPAVSEAITTLEAGQFTFDDSIVITSALAIAIEEFTAGVTRWVIDGLDDKDVRECLQYRKAVAALMWEVQSFQTEVIYSRLKG